MALAVGNLNHENHIPFQVIGEVMPSGLVLVILGVGREAFFCKESNQVGHIDVGRWFVVERYGNCPCHCPDAVFGVADDVTSEADEAIGHDLHSGSPLWGGIALLFSYRRNAVLA